MFAHGFPFPHVASYAKATPKRGDSNTNAQPSLARLSMLSNIEFRFPKGEFETELALLARRAFIHELHTVGAAKRLWLGAKPNHGSATAPHALCVASPVNSYSPHTQLQHDKQQMGSVVIRLFCKFSHKSRRLLLSRFPEGERK